MNHQDIVRLVKSMEIVELTKDTFEGFVKSAYGLFVPGASFQAHYSPGDTPTFRKVNDFSKGKPEYREGESSVVTRIEKQQSPDGSKRWINVFFNMGSDQDFSTWGIFPEQLPEKFGFDAQRALYIAHPNPDLGTPEQPWEMLYLRLE